MRLGATVTGQVTMRAPGGIELPATALTIADNKPAVWVVDPAKSTASPGDAAGSVGSRHAIHEIQRPLATTYW
jgi:hypothetical protein